MKVLVWFSEIQLLNTNNHTTQKYTKRSFALFSWHLKRLHILNNAVWEKSLVCFFFFKVLGFIPEREQRRFVLITTPRASPVPVLCPRLPSVWVRWPWWLHLDFGPGCGTCQRWPDPRSFQALYDLFPLPPAAWWTPQTKTGQRRVIDNVVMWSECCVGGSSVGWKGNYYLNNT